MLPPGLFQPSHSSTLVTVGCLARNPPVRIRARATGVGCEAPAGSRSFEGFEPELSSGSNPAGFAGIWVLLLSVEDGGDGAQGVSCGATGQAVTSDRVIRRTPISSGRTIQMMSEVPTCAHWVALMTCSVTWPRARA